MAMATPTPTTTRPTLIPSPFPATTKTSTAEINNTQITATSTLFTDKILITLTTPSGQLPHWIHVPLSTSSSTDPMFTSTNASNTENALLPRPDLTATTILGGTQRDYEVVGQTLATMIASAILMKSQGEERILVLGMGVPLDEGGGREIFEKWVGLALEVL